MNDFNGLNTLLCGGQVKKFNGFNVKFNGLKVNFNGLKVNILTILPLLESKGKSIHNSINKSFTKPFWLRQIKEKKRTPWANLKRRWCQ